MTQRDPWDTMREFDGQIQHSQEEIAQESLTEFIDHELDKADEHNAMLDPFVYEVDGLYAIQIEFPDGPKEFRAPTRRELYDKLRSAL